METAEVYKLIASNGVLLDRLEIIEPALTAAIRLTPDDHLAHFHMGMLYYTTSRFASAEQEFLKVVSLNASFAKGYDMLGQVRGDRNRSIRHCVLSERD
jgi:predicted Zn-dependent protease